MRYAVLLSGAILLSGASPTLASASFECEATDDSGVLVGGLMARAIAAPLDSAELRLGDSVLSTTSDPPGIAIGRFWLDADELRLDLVDPQMLRFEAQLRARTNPAGDTRGTLTRDGRDYPVHCIFG